MGGIAAGLDKRYSGYYNISGINDWIRAAQFQLPNPGCVTYLD
jgi:hypothetical protein